MTMRTFVTETEFTGAIDAALQGRVTSADIRNALTAGIGTGEQDSRDDPVNADGALNLRLNSWILREQDIPVTELSAFAALAWKAWRKGAKLSKAEIAALGFLEVQGPMSLDDLKARAPAALEGVSATDVERAIQSLQDVELRDGDIVALIRKDASGLWRARPI